MTARLITMVKTMRPPFLLLSPVCIFLACGTAVASGARLDGFLVFLVFFGSICAHISVNTFNEYSDYKSGLDTMTRRTPFSGGSGALVENPGALGSVRLLAYFTLLITIVLGIYFIFLRGWTLLVLLLTGCAIILAYTQVLNRQPWLCLIAPGLSFGTLYVIGAHKVLSGEYHLLAIYVSFIPFLLVNNLLLLNQYPDADADSKVGRRHFPILYGIAASNRVYCLANLLVLLLLCFGVYFALLPGTALFALVPLSLTLVVTRGIYRYEQKAGKLNPYLGMNVLVCLSVPMVIALALVFSHEV